MARRDGPKAPRYTKWLLDYKASHPNLTDKEICEEFKRLYFNEPTTFEYLLSLLKKGN